MDPAPQKKPLTKRIQERLAASRFLTVSLLIHAIIVVVGGTVVLFKAIEQPPDFTAGGDGGLVGDEAAAEAPPQDSQASETAVFTPETPQINTPSVDAITTTSTTSASFQIAAAPMPVKPVSATAMTKTGAAAASAAMRGGGRGVPGAMGGRLGGTARDSARRQYSGKDKSEKAVMGGLRWLKQHQNEDGSWSTEHQPGMTGFAVLCFLGHGELPDSPEFGPTVKKGLDWLLAKGTEFDGRLSLTKNGWGGSNYGVYEHAIATYAMGEYYALTKDDRFAELLKKSVGYIVDGQGPDGGWMYRYDKSTGDTSVSGWQIQALKAAHLTGLEIPGVDAALDKAMLNLQRVQSKEGYGYRQAGDHVATGSLDGVGALCTYFWKQDKDKGPREAIEHLLKLTKTRPIKYKGDAADLYAWYYNTQACLMFGGSSWSEWNRLFQDEIADNQSADGSWPPVPNCKAPGHEYQIKTDGCGPYYRTSLCVLMLEVFYRYSPSMK
jgi:hypothetical protein